MGASIFNGVSKKGPSYILKSKAPTSLMGAAKVMCQASLFFVKTLAIPGIQLIILFRLVVTLCENGGTTNAMVRLEDIFFLPIITHLVF